MDIDAADQFRQASGFKATGDSADIEKVKKKLRKSGLVSIDSNVGMTYEELAQIFEINGRRVTMADVIIESRKLQEVAPSFGA